MLTRGRAEQLTGGFEGRRLIVLGDVMLDEFIWGKVRRISPEAPVPVVEIERETLALGGAGNVSSNLRALGARPLQLGVIGDDPDARRLRSAFDDLGMSCEGLVVDAQRRTTLKTRIIAQHQQVVRADRESRATLTAETELKIIEVFSRQIESAEALVVSDYGKGLLTPGLLKSVLQRARQQGIAVVVDPKSRSFSHYQPVTIITPNHHEAAIAAGIEIDGEEAVVEAGRRILSSLDCHGVLITRGEEGMSLFTDDGKVNHIPTVAREVYDVTGAGDTVLATLGLALVAGASPLEAAILANHAAGVVVGKLGTATVSREELLATF